MILNRQRGVCVSVSGLNRFAERAQRELRLPAEALSVCLVTNAQMAAWNHAFRGKDGPTDVLSFPTEGSKGSTGSEREHLGRSRSRGSKGRRGGGRNFARTHLSTVEMKGARTDGFSSPSFKSSTSYLGDIAIAPAVARTNAGRFGRTLDEELRILILHGMLHLMGYDHEIDDGEMEWREQRLRKALGLD